MSEKRKTPPVENEVDDAIELDIDDVEELNSAPQADAGELAKLKSDFEKAKTDYLYLGAEFDNYKKHAIKERSDLVRYGAERFVRDLLDIVDNFERALQMEVTPENQAKLREGVELTYRELQSLLTRHGVQEMNPVGQPFDPNTQEAISSEPNEALPPGSVSRVFRKAYRLHDRLLRPAQVIVALAPPKADGNGKG